MQIGNYIKFYSLRETYLFDHDKSFQEPSKWLKLKNRSVVGRAFLFPFSKIGSNFATWQASGISQRYIDKWNISDGDLGKTSATSCN